MITDEKIKEVKKMLRSGVPAGEVKDELVRQGYSDEDIKKVFVPHKYDMRSWYLFFAIVVFCIGAWLYLQNDGVVNVIILSLSVMLFFQYFRESERIKRNNKQN